MIDGAKNSESTFRIRKSFTMAFVTNCADNNIPGKAANHVKMKPKGSGNCMGQEERKVNQKKIKEYIS